MSEIIIDDKLLSEIVGLSNEHIYIFKSDNLKCYFANHTAKQSSGYVSTKINQLTATDIYAEYNQEAFKKLIAPLLKNKRKEISFCTNIKRKMGVVYPVETQLKKITRNNEEFILAINKDISRVWYKVKKLNRQRRLSEKYIKKNKQKANFLANAAHDMRTTINSIMLANKLLFLDENNKYLNGRFKKFANAIHHSGNHLMNYIDEFFQEHSSSNPSKEVSKECINIRSFGRNICHIFEPVAIENNINFKYEISDLEAEGLNTNPTYLKRILKNILSNAFKYTSRGQVIFKIYTPKEKGLEKNNFSTTDVVAFQVQDTGIGIPEVKQNQIFDRYTRVNETTSVNGEGLGLNICKQLTVVLDGHLEMESNEGAGSTFTLYLPARNTADKEQISFNSITKIPDQDVDYNKETTILIVDDDQTHNEAIKEYLQYTFDRCVTANSKSEAYRRLKEESINCVVLDYIISDKNCIKIAHQLRNSDKHSQIPIIIYTGKKLSEKEQVKLDKYADAIVKKSANSYEKLVSTIHSYL